MIDIHSHILPGLDDGSQSMEESLAMVRLAAENGTTDIVATPHSNVEYEFNPDVVASKIAELAAAAGPAPQIHRGCDFHLSYDNVQDAVANPGKYTINNKSYLLVEFSDLLIFKNTDEIFDLLLEAGMIPVITHPERNILLQQRLTELEGWVAKGCLNQVTGASFDGRFGKRAKRFAESLLEKGLVHVVASDAHDPEDRTPDLSGAHRYLTESHGQECADLLLTENPRRIINGEHIDATQAPHAQSPGKWYRFWS